MTTFNIINDNCLDALKALPANSVHMIVTDPPYFIDGMGDDWNRDSLNEKTTKAGVVGSLPVGMKFDPAQGRNFQAFMAKVSEEAFRVLKPGGFYIAFSQARLYHRLGVAVEDAGFEIRDMLGWTYEGQAKAFSQDHFVKKQIEKGLLSKSEGDAIIARMGGRKTPQLKPQIEPMVLGQKPKAGTFINNWLTHELGLVDTTQSLDGKFPGNMMPVPKPRTSEKGSDNDHLTVKPVALIEHLIKLFTLPGQVVLDPFLGSGSHGVAAVRAGREFIGIEIEKGYARIAERRIMEASREAA
jgi:site-specific DNA-methyltransferase (adenine-specific)